jgi:hypothetical protein
MVFSSPIWDARKNIYTIDIKPEFVFEEQTLYSGLETHINPDIQSELFNEYLKDITKILVVEGKNWFASPIKETIFLKKLKHTFYNYYNSNDSGKVKYSWIPYLLEISPRSFDLYWKANVEKVTNTIIPVNYMDFSEDLLEPKPLRTLIIQNETKKSEDIDLVEYEIPFEGSQQLEYEISSRAIIKKKVREARLIAAIATMKAERMAEKYFRRYGIHTDLDENESELSFDSEEEKNE